MPWTLHFDSAAPLWVLLALNVVASLAWQRVGSNLVKHYPALGWLAVSVATGATVALTLLPVAAPDETVITWTWVFGNFFLLWPMATTLHTYISRRQTIAFLAIFIVAIELVQALVNSLGRYGDVRDIVLNLLGAALVLRRSTSQSD